MRKKAIAIAVAAVVLVALACLWRSWVDSSEAARERRKPKRSSRKRMIRQTRLLPSSWTTTSKGGRLLLLRCGIRRGNPRRKPVGIDRGSYAEFSRGGVVERAGEESKAQPFAITAVEHEAKSDGSGGSVDTWTGSALLESGEAIFTLSQARSADAGDLPWELSCSGLSLSKSYRLVKRSGGVEVSDLSAAHGVIGGEKGAESVARAIEEHVAKIAPTATKATWDGRAEVDFGSGRAVLAFELDDSAKTTVEADVSMETGKSRSNDKREKGMGFRNVKDRLKGRKVGKEQLLPVCIALFLAAIGLSVAMTLGLQACSAGLRA